MAIKTTSAVFNGAQPLSGDLPYIDIVWSTAYSASTVYRVGLGSNVTDSFGAIVINFTNKTATGVRVLASSQFTGTVEIVAYDV